MKRTLFVSMLSIFLVSLTQLNAQKANIGVNLAGAFPVSSFYSAADFGFGGDVSFDYYFNDKFDLGIEAGYRAFPLNAPNADGEAVNVIPIQLTAGWHNDVNDWIDFYGEIGGGLFLTTNTYQDVSRTNSGISPRLGFAFELTPLLFLDVNANYTHVFATEGNDLDYLGLNVGLLYTLAEF